MMPGKTGNIIEIFVFTSHRGVRWELMKIDEDVVNFFFIFSFLITKKSIVYFMRE